MILIVKRLSGFLLLLLLLIPAATAATVTISPNAIESGDTVTVTVNDLPNGTTFSLGIRGEFAATPGETFAFTAREITLPFALDQGDVSAYTKGTNWTELSAKLPDGGSVILYKDADKNGEVRISQPRNIGSGTLNLVALGGEAAAERITADLTMMGTKRGPDSGTISFAIDGITQGTATISVYIGGSEALSRTITIGGGIPTPTQTQTPPPVTTPTPAATEGSGSNGGSSGGSSGSGSSGSGLTPHTSTVTSADGKASISGTDMAGSGLLPLAAQGSAPAGWALAGNAYAVTPANRTFDPAVVLSFPLPANEMAATIARLENGTWLPVASKIEGDQITTAVSLSGTYALLIAAPAAEVTTATPTTTIPATTTPTAAPMAFFLPVIALAILALWQGRRI